MLNEVVLRQKKEKEELLNASYVQRAKISQAKKWLNSDLIKVILGPRRAGKSVFSFMLLKDTPFMYFNFDEEIIPFFSSINLDQLLKQLHTVYGNITTILFDEIQNLPNWELFVNRLQRQKYNLILTGSNAKLLSSELATVLTGRHIPIEIMPFDFKEFLEAKNYKIDPQEQILPKKEAEILNLLEEYLLNGGFPEVVVKGLNSKEYLNILFDSLIFKDVVKRHRVKFSTQIDNLATYLIDNFSNYYTLRRLVKVLNFRSGITVEKYLQYLQEAYILFSLQRYSNKSGERITAPKKIYVIDSGFIQAKAIQHSPDKGRLMENLVFIELIKRGLKPNIELFYYKTRNNREVDFVIKKKMIVEELIQVSYQIAEPTAQEREIKSLIEASEELNANNLTILTWDKEKQLIKNKKTINFIPVWKWLMKAK